MRRRASPSLTIALPSTPETIDPHQFRSVLSGSIIGLMGEGLLTRDPQTMELKPLLAESWRNVNPTTWEFKLRKGVKFHNGEEFTGESVKFTIERIVNSKLNTLGKLTFPPSFGPEVDGGRSAHRADRHQGAGSDGGDPAWPRSR